eukprot:4529636-Prymnesium_polylepis.1
MLTVFFVSAAPAPLCAALLPAVRAALAAPPGSPDAAVNVEQLLTFVVALSKPVDADAAAGGAPPSTNLHEQLGLALACEALVAQDEPEVRHTRPRSCTRRTL